MFEGEIMNYYDEIYRFCFHHVGNVQTAQDLCQETFLSFLESAGRYRFQGKTKNYLYTIARNKCTDYHRKIKPVYTDELPDELFEPDMSSYGNVEIRLLLKLLPEEERDAVILKYLQQLKYTEIAKIMGISQTKAKNLVKKGLQRLESEVKDI